MPGIIVKNTGQYSRLYMITHNAPASEINSVLNAGIEAQFLAAGWTLHDAAASATSRVYRGTTANGVKKFVQWFWPSNTAFGTAGGYFALYEDWNATTHVGTNLAYASNVATVWTSLGAQVWVSIGPNHAFIRHDSGGADANERIRFCGVFDYRHDAADEDATYPATIFIAPDMLQLGNANYSIPRARNGAVGQASGAYANTSIGTIMGRSEQRSTLYNKSIASILAGTNHSANYGMYTNNLTALTPYAGVQVNATPAYANSLVKGRVHGLKLLSGALTGVFGSFLEPIFLNVDAEGFLDPNGTPQLHYIINYEAGGSTALRVAIPG